MTGALYILESLKERQYYIGSTNNVKWRLAEHNHKKKRYTSKYTPWNLYIGLTRLARKR